MLMIPLSCLIYIGSACTTPGPPPPPTLMEVNVGGGFGSALSFSPDSRWLAFTDGRTVRIYEFGAGRDPQTLHEFKDDHEMSSVAFTRDSKTVLVGTWSNRMHVVDVPSGKVRESITFEGRTHVRTVAASPIDDFVAVVVNFDERIGPNTSASESAIEVFRLSKPAARTTLMAKGAPAEHAPAFSPDGRFLMAIAEGRGGIRTWQMLEMQPGDTISTLPNTFAFAIDPGTDIIASGGRDAQIELWSRAQNRRLESRSARNIVEALAFHPSGSLIAACNHYKFLSGSYGSTITVWDKSGKRKNSFRIFESGVDAMGVSPDGKYFAVSGADPGTYRVKLWDWPTVEGVKRP
jgi:WD40 repeat protein